MNNSLNNHIVTSSNPFSHVAAAPDDPILGLTEDFKKDSREFKVNLGIGVYQDNEGRIPLFDAVKEAERAILANPISRSYLPIEGHALFRENLEKLVFGEDCVARNEGRVVSAQTIAGSGALRLGADTLAFALPNTTIYLSNPSWANHKAIFERAGLKVSSYPYFRSESKSLDIDGLLDTLSKIEAKSVVLLHACCHNPSGVDPSPEQWGQILDVLAERRAIVFIDMAYQGFGDGPNEDTLAIKLAVQKGLPVFVATSCSKNFGLYGERIGLLSFVGEDSSTAKRILTQWKRLVRGNYSSPPTHGATIVSKVLSDDKLRESWIRELALMRSRITDQRNKLKKELESFNLSLDFSFIVSHRGMFTYTGISEAAVEELREKFAIYLVSSGRMCVAALNDRNLEYVASSFARVLRGGF
jgi:aromatic-amino-acid transaminase